MPATDVGTSEDLLAELSDWVKIETPTTDGMAVNRLMDVAERELTRAGAAMTRVPGRGRKSCNRVRGRRCGREETSCRAGGR